MAQEINEWFEELVASKAVLGRDEALKYASEAGFDVGEPGRSAERLMFNCGVHALRSAECGFARTSPFAEDERAMMKAYRDALVQLLVGLLKC